MKRLDLTEIARADLASVRRYSTRTWGRDQTGKYMVAIRETLKGLVRARWSRVGATTSGRASRWPPAAVTVSSSRPTTPASSLCAFSTTAWTTVATWAKLKAHVAWLPASPPISLAQEVMRTGLGALRRREGTTPTRTFDRYTEAARRVLFFARYEAGLLGSAEIESEHVLLGLVRDEVRLLHDGSS